MCKELKRVLKEYGQRGSTPQVLFDVSGGCGIDISLGKGTCMASEGIWFEFCPFCGAQIVSKYHPRKHCWSWKEVTQSALKQEK